MQTVECSTFIRLDVNTGICSTSAASSRGILRARQCFCYSIFGSFPDAAGHFATLYSKFIVRRNRWRDGNGATVRRETRSSVGNSRIKSSKVSASLLDFCDRCFTRLFRIPTGRNILYHYILELANTLLRSLKLQGQFDNHINVNLLTPTREIRSFCTSTGQRSVVEVPCKFQIGLIRNNTRPCTINIHPLLELFTREKPHLSTK